MKVFTTPAAEADIEAIGSWIAKESPSRAISFVQQLRKSCRQVGDMPKGFIVVQRYLDFEIRRKPFRDYLIFYRIKNNAVEILHVVHGARDYSELL
jgi:toxin ParE1/3/4